MIFVGKLITKFHKLFPYFYTLLNNFSYLKKKVKAPFVGPNSKKFPAGLEVSFEPAWQIGYWSLFSDGNVLQCLRQDKMGNDRLKT